MKGPKPRGKILVNSSTNSNLNQDTDQETWKDLNKIIIDKMCLYYLIKHA